MKVIIMEEVNYFIKELDFKARSKARWRIKLLGEHGHMLRMPYSRHILSGIFELRTIGKDNVRLIYTFRNETAIIFHAFVKKTEKISTYEMNIITHKFNNCIYGAGNI